MTNMICDEPQWNFSALTGTMTWWCKNVASVHEKFIRCVFIFQILKHEIIVKFFSLSFSVHYSFFPLLSHS